MDNRVMKTADESVALEFNDIEMCQQVKNGAANYMLYESNEEPIKLIEKMKESLPIDKLKKCINKDRHNSYYYMKKLVISLLLIDYSLIDRNRNLKNMR